LINSNFRKLWIGQTISVVGDEVFSTTLLLWVGIILLAGRPYAPVVSSAVLIVTSVVIVLVGPLAGVFVDRWNKRRTMLRADLGRAVLIGVLILVSSFPDALPLPATLVTIGGVVALATAAAQFFNPARTVLIRDVVPADQQGRASSYSQTAGALAGIIGPPLAAPLLVGVGVPWAITINAVSFVVSYVAIRLVRVPEVEAPSPLAATEPPSVRREFLAGLRYMRTERLVLALLVTAVLINLGIGAVSALDVYFVAENLHGDPKWFGLLGGAFGIGAVIGAATGGLLGDRVGHIRVVTSGLIATGLLLVAYSRLGSVWPALVVIALLGFAVGALNSALSPVLIATVPRELLGRVMAVIGPANRLGGIVSITVSSVLVSTVLRGLDADVAGVHFGRIDTMFLFGGLIVIVGGVYFTLASRPQRLPPSDENEGTATPQSALT
jgi:MFS family permease